MIKAHKENLLGYGSSSPLLYSEAKGQQGLLMDHNPWQAMS